MIPYRLDLNTPKVYVKPKRDYYIRSPVRQKIQQFKRFIENHRRHIVCVIVVYGITAGVALERCYCKKESDILCCRCIGISNSFQMCSSDYSLQATSTGMPETSVVGVVVSRGSAAAISFLFPYMLLTVCRNLITMCRETFLNRYIPFDSAIDLHRYMAMTAIVLTGCRALQYTG